MSLYVRNPRTSISGFASLHISAGVSFPYVFSVCLQHHSRLLNHSKRHHYPVLHFKNNAMRSRVSFGADMVLLVSG